MAKRWSSALTLFILLSLQYSFAKVEIYKIDPVHSAVEWKVKHLPVAKVVGTFSKITGTILFDPENLEASKVEATINVFSLNSYHRSRDIQLLSADYFNATQFKTIDFVSQSIQKSADNRFVLRGKLTLHGVSRRIELSVKLLGTDQDPWGNQRIGFKADTMLKRSHYEMTGGTTEVGDKVEIHLLIEGVRVSE